MVFFSQNKMKTKLFLSMVFTLLCKDCFMSCAFSHAKNQIFATVAIDKLVRVHKPQNEIKCQTTNSTDVNVLLYKITWLNFMRRVVYKFVLAVCFM